MPVTVIIWVAVHRDFQGQPPGPPEGRYAWQILDDLLAEAMEDQQTHPVLGLCVHPENVRAIRLYERAGFVGDLEPFRDKATGLEYRRMALVLNPEALLRAMQASGKNKGAPQPPPEAVPADFKLPYPLFAINLGNGYYALESTDKASPPEFAVVIFTSEELATAHMTAEGI